MLRLRGWGRNYRNFYWSMILTNVLNLHSPIFNKQPLLVILGGGGLGDLALWPPFFLLFFWSSLLRTFRTWSTPISPSCLVSTGAKLSNQSVEKVEVESELGDVRLLSNVVLLIAFDPRMDSFLPYVVLDNWFNFLASCLNLHLPLTFYSYWTELFIF